MTERLFLLKPKVVFSALADLSEPLTYPITGFKTNSFNQTPDVLAGQTLLLGSEPGYSDYGRQRVKGLTMPDTVWVQLPGTSYGTNDGELQVVDGAYVTILDDYRVWGKVPRYLSSGQIYKDWTIAPGGIASVFVVANGGPGTAGTIDGSGSLTVAFNSAASFQFSSGTGNYPVTAPQNVQWLVEDGTIVVGSTSTPQMTATFPPGFRWVRLTVSQAGGYSHTKMIPVLAIDPANDPCIQDFQVVNRTWRPDGQSLTLRIFETVNRVDYPDGTLVMLFDDEPSSPSDRTHMKFIGWLESDTSQRRSLRENDGRVGIVRETTLDAVDVLGKLKGITGFAQTLTSVTSGWTGINDWFVTDCPSALYYFWYLLYLHSTALDVADFILDAADTNTFHFAVWELDQTTLYAQLQRIAQALTPDHQVNVTRRGQMIVVTDPNLQAPGNRKSGQVIDLTLAEWQLLTFRAERLARVGQILAYAMLSDDQQSTAIAALAPGTARGQGAQYLETNYALALTQSALNGVEGRRYARLNRWLIEVTVTVDPNAIPDNYELGRLDWVRLHFGDVFRGPFQSILRGLVRELNLQTRYTLQGITRHVTLVWEPETDGPAAATYTPPGVST